MKSLRHAALAATLPFLLHACSKSSAGLVTAYVAKGPVTGAQCELRRAANDTVVAGPVESEAGQVSFGVLNYHGLAYVACQGGTYRDEVSGHELSLRQGTLRAAKMVSGAAHFVVTPVTEIAVKRALAASGKNTLEEKHVAQANQATADYFGLSRIDIVTDNPTDVTEQAVNNTPEGWYGAVLASLSGMLFKESGLAQLPIADSSVIDVAIPLDVMTSRLSDPANNEASLDGLSSQLHDLAKPGTVPNPVPYDILAGILGGIGNDKTDNAPGVMPDDDLFVFSVTPDTVAMHGGVSVDVVGGGFEDPVQVYIEGELVPAVTIHSNQHLSLETYPIPYNFESEGTTLDLTIEQGDKKYTLTDAFTISCVYDNCNPRSKAAEGCPL